MCTYTQTTSNPLSAAVTTSVKRDNPIDVNEDSLELETHVTIAEENRKDLNEDAYMVCSGLVSIYMYAKM